MYQQGFGVYQKAHACELDQTKLILMMYAGAINFLNKALKVANNDNIEMGMYLSKSKNVILELMSSLNLEKGSEMGNVLLRMYLKLYNKLNIAHMQDDVEKITEVRDSLYELEETWKQVFESNECRKFKRKNAI
ncbi:MAG: flagellar export chaperone FliS [Candidatus Latescibacteria bacterium]|jgi:flagellar secretion chaperone FliS|nr:flagellar export chaperone FliS [Candidatus Latescibacterota bacterium]